MSTLSLPWRDRKHRAAITTINRPQERNRTRTILRFILSLMLIGQVAPLALLAQNLGKQPAFGQAVQGQQATTVEGTVLNIVNWGCNVVAPVVGIACLGIAAWHYKNGRGFMGWGGTGVGLMVISGLGRLAEGLITQAQGIQ